MLKEVLKDYLKRAIVNRDDVALSFSGGTDSLGILFCCLELGIKPTLYTYVVDSYPSKDLSYSMRISTLYDLKLNVVIIPSDIGQLVFDVFRMLRDGIRGKVNLQCMHGHYYVAPVVKESQILNGSGVDGIYGVYREYLFDKQVRTDKNYFDSLRRKHLDNPNDDAMLYQLTEYLKHDVKVLYPYRQSGFTDLLMNKTWNEINKPKFKNIFTKEFGEMFNGYYRQRGSQQIMAGTRELHQKLLNTFYNTKEYKRVDYIYKNMLREMELNS